MDEEDKNFSFATIFCYCCCCCLLVFCIFRVKFQPRFIFFQCFGRIAQVFALLMPLVAFWVFIMAFVTILHNTTHQQQEQQQQHKNHSVCEHTVPTITDADIFSLLQFLCCYSTLVAMDLYLFLYMFVTLSLSLRLPRLPSHPLIFCVYILCFYWFENTHFFITFVILLGKSNSTNNKI